MYELQPTDEDRARSPCARASSSPSTSGSSRASDGARPAGRPDQRADRGGRRGRHAHRGRADRHVRPAAQRRPRGHRERHRQRLVVAVPPPRRSCARLRAEPALVPTAVEELHAVRHAAADVRALGAGGRRDRWHRDPARARSSGCCSARRTATPTSSRTRTRFDLERGPEPAPDLRRGDPLLPGRAAGQARAPDLVLHGAPSGSPTWSWSRSPRGSRTTSSAVWTGSR